MGRKQVKLDYRMLSCGFLTILFMVITIYSTRQYDNYNLLQEENDMLCTYISEQKTNQDINSSGYVKLESSIMELGASYSQALTVYEAATKYGISPKILAALIFTESGFISGVQHDIKAVKGISGVHTKYWDNSCPYNPRNEDGAIYAGAFILSKHLKDSGSNYLEAITRYKGKSKEGKKRADRVLQIRERMQ